MAGLLALGYGALRLWRAYRAVTRLSLSLGTYALSEATAIEEIATRLNEHGFALEHSASELFPKLEYLAILLRQPLAAAALPWALRRILARPYKKR